MVAKVKEEIDHSEREQCTGEGITFSDSNVEETLRIGGCFVLARTYTITG
jgi:hypothetical protein